MEQYIKLYISVGEKITVKLIDGLLISGVYFGCNSDATGFHMKDSEGTIVEVNSKSVIDIRKL